MASRDQRLLIAALVLAATATGATATEEDYTAKFNYNVEDVVNGLEESFVIPSLTVPEVTKPGTIELKVDLANVNITGLKEFKGTQFTYDPDTTIVKITLTEPSLEIYAQTLAMQGVLFGNIEIDGTGDGWFLLENFKCTIEGPASTFDFNGTLPYIHFDDVKLTLDLEQWTVDMRGLTPGSDLTQMMNSVLTMLGPEIFHKLGDTITNIPGFRLLVNRHFNNPGDGTEETQSETNGEAANIQTILNPDTDWIPQEAMQEYLKLRHPRRMANLGRHS